MKILYDYQAFNQHHGGVSRYHVELIKNLRKIGVECDIPYLFSGNVYLEEIGVQHANLLQYWNSGICSNGMKWMDQKICLHSIKKGKFDIFHPTFLNPYYVGHTKGKPVVQTMHDLIHEKTDRFDSAIVRARRAQVLKDADAVICISKETKNDLLRFYDVPEEKVHLVYHGSDQNITSCPELPMFQFPYILYIGNRKEYKNWSRLLEAFSMLSKDVHLVCTGVPFDRDEFQQIKRLSVSDRVHQFFASENEMINLLSYAVAFIYPSMMEGFGLPILEAYRSLCPCIISDILCFHEVAGDAAVYFNPKSVDDIFEKLAKTIFDEQKLHKLKLLGAERLKKFTWEKTAKETLEVYKTLL